MSDITRANAHLAAQAAFATLDLQTCIPKQTGNNPAVKAILSDDTKIVTIEVKYPVAKPSGDYDATKSLLGIYNSFEKINSALLPFYFGNRLEFIEYELLDDQLLGKFQTRYSLAESNDTAIEFDFCDIKPIEFNDFIKFQSHEITRKLDYIIGNASIPRLVRIPTGHLAIDRQRLMESVYSIDLFKMGKLDIIRIILIAPIYLKGDNRKRLQALQEAIQQYATTERNILDYWWFKDRDWRRKQVMEMRIIA